MAEKDNQKIAVLLSLDENDKSMILWGIKLSAIFRKELCLLYLVSKKDNRESINNQLARYMLTVNREIPELVLSTLILKLKPRHLPLILADNYEVIMIILSSSRIKKHSWGLSSSPIPYLFVNNQFQETNDLKKIIIPVDLRMVNNDSGIWGSYFGRFNNSEIILLAADDHNREEQNLVIRNVTLIETLFRKLSLSYKIFKGKKNSIGIQFEALELAKNSGAELLIATGSSVISIIDLLIGLPELKLVRKADFLPILVINPRRNMYVMCD